MKKLVALVAALAFGIMSSSFGAIEVLAAAKMMEMAVVKAGDIDGKVMDSAGNPVEGAVVTLTDSTGNIIASVKTGKTGCYAGLTVQPGTYVISFDGKISAPIDVTYDAESSQLNAALPAGDPASYSAGVAQWMWIAGFIFLIGGGMAAAGAFESGC